MHEASSNFTNGIKEFMHLSQKIHVCISSMKANEKFQSSREYGKKFI